MILISSELDLLDEKFKSSNGEINIFNIPVPVQFKLLYKWLHKDFLGNEVPVTHVFTHRKLWLSDWNNMQNLEVVLENINVITIPYSG